MPCLLKEDSCAVVEMDYNPDRLSELAAPPFAVYMATADPDPRMPGGDHLPHQLIDRYVKTAVRRAVTEQMSDGRWYAEITLLPGVWAEGSTEADALAELGSVTESWVLLKIEDHDRDIPVLETLDLNGL